MGLAHYCDRGGQHLSIKYTDALPPFVPCALRVHCWAKEAGIELSVGGVGDSYDNALAETISRSLRLR